MGYAGDQALVEDLQKFFQRYYSDDIAELARKYPREKRSLYINWSDLNEFDPDLASDYVALRKQVVGQVELAL